MAVVAPPEVVADNMETTKANYKKYPVLTH
jgi:hypothetical protein